MVTAAKLAGVRRRRQMKHSGRNYRRQGIAGIIIGALLIVAVSLLAGCGGDDQQATANLSVDTGGKLQLAETTYDFGSIPVGQQVQHDFVITNTGTGPLDLGQISTKRLEGCWDITAVVGSTTIQPDETTNLSITMHMGKGMGGKHLFEVTVNSNDPAPAVNKVDVRANFTE